MKKQPTQKQAELAVKKILMDVIKTAQAEARKEIENNIGFLRQWLNEKPKDLLVTNQHIKDWLGL